jgi:hypothetical protein
MVNLIASQLIAQKLSETQSQKSNNNNNNSNNGKTEIVKIVVIGGVVLVVLAISYFGIIKPILNKIGLTKDKDEREGDKDKDKLSRSQVLSPTFYRNNKSKISISSQKAFESATRIYNAKGIVWDDESSAVGGITGAGSLVNVSYISDRFNTIFGQSLQSYLASFLEPENWTQIDDYIRKTKNF